MDNFDPNKTPKKQVLSAQIDLSKFEKATEDEKRQQDVMSQSTSFFKDGMRKLFKNPLAVASIIVLVAIIITIIVAPMIVPYGYEEILSVNGKRDKGAKNLAPFTYSKAEQKFIDEGGTRFPHIMGTDEQCRDYFIRVIYGARISLVIGFFAKLEVSCGAYRSFFVFSSYYTGKAAGCQHKFAENASFFRSIQENRQRRGRHCK